MSEPRPWGYALSPDDAAAFSGISKSALERLVAEGKAPSPVKITDGKRGRKVWLRRTLEEWLDSLAGRRAKREADEWDV